MGKTTIDFNDYEAPKYQEYDGDDPKPGWYTLELQRVSQEEEDGDIRWIFVIADGGPYDGWAGFWYGNMDNTKWKNQDAVRAIQGGAEKAISIDFTSEVACAALVKKAKRVRGNIRPNTNPNTGETRLSLRKVRPLLEEAGKSANAVKGAAAADDLEDTATDDEEPEDYTREELADMDVKALKAILKDEFEFKVAELRPIKTQQAAIDAIIEAQGGDPEDEDADEADDADEDGTDDGDFDDDFDDADGDDDQDDDDADDEPEPEPEPEPAPRRRRAAPAKAAPAKAAPAKAAPAKAAPAASVPQGRTRRARRA